MEKAQSGNALQARIKQATVLKDKGNEFFESYNFSNAMDVVSEICRNTFWLTKLARKDLQKPDLPTAIRLWLKLTHSHLPPNHICSNWSLDAGCAIENLQNLKMRMMKRSIFKKTLVELT